MEMLTLGSISQKYSISYQSQLYFRFLIKIIEGKVFCIHGGLSPSISAIDQIRLLNRKVEIPQEGAFSDLMWSDPEDIETWIVSNRGAGYLFGCRVVNEVFRSIISSLIILMI